MEDPKVKSLSKAMKVLECFIADRRDLGVTQISQTLGIGKSSVSNIASTFRELGYLEQDTHSGRYRLGLKLLEFSYLINEQLGYQKLFHDIMLNLSTQFDAITYFAICRERQVFYLCNVHPPVAAYTFPYRSIMGEKAPLHCTSVGKAMLPYLPPEELDAVLSAERAAYTQNTITDAAALRDEIATTKARGYAIDQEEHEYGVFCIGVPVLESDGSLIGGLSISSPNLDLADGERTEYVRALKSAARSMRDRIPGQLSV
ncbi:MAG: IclR family transcriptional regulator [Bifidobacteriaceae bacterium]|nr:IclR family transcriptional regulator [Bifidobacteriaceae bacterium]